MRNYLTGKERLLVAALAFCVPCLLASCDHDVHDGEGDGGLSVSLA